jgi:homoserine dehydrogenase
MEANMVSLSRGDINKMLNKRLILCGFGNVGRAFTRLLAEKHAQLKQKYGLNLELTAVVDIGGAAISEKGPLPALELLFHVENGGTVETFARYGSPAVTGTDVIANCDADVLVEATPTNLIDGEPARGHIFAALEKGKNVVSANKGPLVLFYKEIRELAETMGCGFYMSAATGAALPTLDVGVICLAGAQVLAIEGILNGTTNYILTRMHTEKSSYETALKEAQQMGIAETNPKLDVEGWDTCNKLVLMSNRVFGTAFSPKDVKVTGITGVTMEDIERAIRDGKVIKLLGTATIDDGDPKLEVKPKALGMDHPMASINYSEKGVSYVTDTMGRITVSGGQSSPTGAAAAILKDLIHMSVFSTFETIPSPQP